MTFESETRWHLDKRLNVGHILTTFTVAAGLFVWGSTIETRVTVLEEKTVHQQKVGEDIRDELIRMNQKMDKLLEKFYSNGGYRK